MTDVVVNLYRWKNWTLDRRIKHRGEGETWEIE